MVRYYGRGGPVHEGLTVLGDRSRLEMGSQVVVSIVRDLARSARPLLPRGRARFSSRLDVIGVFLGVRLGVLGRTTAFALGWGIDALILSLSLRVCGKVNRRG